MKLFTIVQDKNSQFPCRDYIIKTEAGKFVVGNPGLYDLERIHRTTAQPAHFLLTEAMRFIEHFQEEGFIQNPRRV